MKPWRRPSLAALGICLAAGAAHGDLLALLAGEYNNNEQVWQRALDGAKPVPRRHWKFAPTGDGGLRLSMTTGQSAGAPAWLLRLTDGRPVTAPAASAPQAGAQPASPSAGGVLHTKVLPVPSAGDSSAAGGEPACQYAWRGWEDGFAGQAQPPGACPDSLPEAWRITSAHLWANQGDGAPDYQARRVDRYQGWIALQRRRIDPQAAADDFIFLADLQAHNEGFVTPITDAGQSTGYAVELARLTYQHTQVPILKLGLIEQATGKTLSYSWAGPQAERIGLNLRWVQSGWTKVRQQR